jgi:dipeptidyl aminopeptidase/acylaminoacyl peptidase
MARLPRFLPASNELQASAHSIAKRASAGKPLGKSLGKPMSRRIFLAILIASVALLQAPPGLAQRRPMQFEDLMKMRRLGEIDISPDSRWVLFTVTDVDLERNTRTPHLWLVSLKGGSEKAITAAMAGESDGQFSPDGKRILFESSRDGAQQIYVADFDSDTGSIGEPARLTSISTGANGAIWSPDGSNVLFTSSVYPDCTGTPQEADACNKERDQAQASAKVKAQIFTHLLFRHWDQFTGEKRSHLFLVPSAGGESRDLTPGVTQEIPPFSVGQPRGYAFSPDGKEIAYEWNTDAIPAISTSRGIFTLSLTDANARPTRISTSAGGNFTPRYSPDGKYLAFRSQHRAGYESDRFRLAVYDRQARHLRDLLPDFDRWVEDLAWSPDSQSIYLLSGIAGEEPVFQVGVSGEGLCQLTELGTYGDLHPTPDGENLIVSRNTLRQPEEIYILRLKKVRSTAEPRDVPERHTSVEPTPIHASTTLLEQDQLTHLNSSVLAQLELPEMERFWFTGAQHTRVEGFLLKPPNFNPQQKYPVKFLIHGGPEGDWGNSWSYRWNPELFAANGYVVVIINPRGSTGYGQAFVDGVNGDWGGKPYVDLMRGLDYAEMKYDFIDKSRECALGASYGGFMADWILGHSNRFRCIVTHDGMFDGESFYGTTDELWFAEWEFHGTPWSSKPDRSLYRRWSPMLYAANFKTPTLIVHGQLDYRLDVSQGFALFTTLQRMNVPSKMLYFPDEGHWVLKPQNSRLWNKTISDWCDLYTKNAGAASGS